MQKFLNIWSGSRVYRTISTVTMIALTSLLLRTTAPPNISLTQALDSRIPYSPGLPAHGFYDNCAPEDATPCYDRLKQMASAGFTLVLNYNQLSGSATEQLVYAHQAALLNMKIIWALNSRAFWDGTNLRYRYRRLASTCNCSDNTSFIQYFIKLVEKLPVTWGYYIGDEVSPHDHERVKVFADLVKRLDPSHPRLLVAGASSVDSVSTNLNPFADTADVLGADYYPVGSTYMPLAATGKITGAVQSIASRVRKPTAIVLQAFSWSQYARQSWRCSPHPSCASFPTQRELCQMLVLTLSNSHPQIVLWYSFYDLLRSGASVKHLQELKSVITICSFSL